MNVNLISPININVTSAKLVLENEGQGTIEFTFLDQPIRIYIPSSYYTHDTDIFVGDRVKLIENFAGINIESSGIVQEIKIDVTDDQCFVLFDEIIPDKILNSVQVNIVSTKPSVLIQVPLRLIEKT